MLVLFSVDLSAQIATTVSGYPVIDLNALSPLKAVLSSTEASAKRTEMNNSTPSNAELLAKELSVSGENGTWNAKMSGKFQVMSTDLVKSYWATAYRLCKEYNGEGGGAGQWRLPTQRELYMIWVLHPQLIGKGGFVEFTTARYWSATEMDTSNAWIVNFHSGSMYTISKGSTQEVVRCIRDL
ncbi:Lcl C-terminal domain-containing protein [Parabacteroides sp.]